MNPENPRSLVLNAREAEILLEPQSHIGEVREQLDRMVTSLMGEVYLSAGEDVRLGSSLIIENESGRDYPVRGEFGVRIGKGEIANLEIGASRLPEAPSDKPVDYFINYEGSDKVVFIENDRMLSVTKSSIESPNSANRTGAGSLRKVYVSPTEYALTRRVLDAAENKSVVETSGYSSAK